MPVGSALVDKARQVISQPSGLRVEGTTQHAQVNGPWFRCRLMIESLPENPDASGGRKRVEVHPNFMYEKRDEHGQPTSLTVENLVEVVSAELGTAVWRLDADPTPVRKKRTLSHFEVNLRRVEDHELRGHPRGV